MSEKKVGRPKMDLQRVTMNLPPAVVSEVERYANRHGLNRTTAFILLVCDALAAHNQEME